MLVLTITESPEWAMFSIYIISFYHHKKHGKIDIILITGKQVLRRLSDFPKGTWLLNGKTDTQMQV